MLYDRILFM